MAGARRPLSYLALASALVAGPGCRALVALVESDTGGGVDAGAAVDGRPGPDADVDCDTWAFQPAHVDPCQIPAPGDPLYLRAGLWSYDTNSGALTDPDHDATFPASALVTQPGGVELRIVSVTDVDIPAGAVLRVYGKRPLVLVSWSDIAVGGTLSVASAHHRAGAGADPDVCASVAATPGEDLSDGAGGGGGGGFGEAGADGGAGRDLMVAGGSGGSAVSAPSAVRGGCPGAAGGNALGGFGGAGGGALQLTARTSVTIDGILHAGGAGGGGSRGDRSGGGGGGSGGLIDLDAPSVTLSSTAIVAANGGGGGGGSDGSAADDGQDGQPSDDDADGGRGQGAGEDGGDGGALDDAAEKGGQDRRGGGGGGGGVGHILVRSSALVIDSDATVSPAAQQP
jgi:hypothetical protein